MVIIKVDVTSKVYHISAPHSSTETIIIEMQLVNGHFSTGILIKW